MIWVDADALPGPLKQYLIKASDRTKWMFSFVANRQLGLPSSPYIRSHVVAVSADAADQFIVAQLTPGDIVITQDIPLASLVVDAAATAISLKGEVWSKDNIKARLHLRDYMDVLRGSGVQTGGPAAFSDRDKKNFADGFEQLLRNYQP